MFLGALLFGWRGGRRLGLGLSSSAAEDITVAFVGREL